MKTTGTEFYKKPEENIEEYYARTTTPDRPGDIITAQTLEPATSMDFKTAEEVPTYPPPEVSEPTAEPIPELGKKEDELSKIIEELTADTLGDKETFRIQEERRRGMGGLRSIEEDYTAQYRQLQAEYKNIDARMQEEAKGRGITKAGLAPVTMSERRKISMQANTVGALLASAQGKVSFAQSQIDRAVKNKYAQAEADRDRKIENLKILMLDPALTAEQKKRASAQIKAQEKEEKEDKEKEASSKTIMNWAIKASAGGATPEQAQAIAKIAMSDEPNLEEAFALYSQIVPEEEPDLLSMSEAKSLGVAYGTTRAEAIALGKTPASPPPSVLSEDKPMSTNQIEQFRRSYGWTPPAGYTWNELLAYMEDNPNATNEELEAGARGEAGEIEETEETENKLSEEYFRANFSEDELFKIAKKAGASKWYTGKITDIKRFFDEYLEVKIKEARQAEFSDEEIFNYLIN